MRILSLSFCLLGLAFISCGQDYNSNSDDEVYATDDGLPDGSPRFQKAFVILRDRCMGCHQNAHSHWKTLRTEQAWQKAGYVTPGDKTKSSIISKLINEGGNMPAGAGALPQDEYLALVRWVEEMP